MTTKLIYASTADFYRNRRGELSGECDFGVWWYTPQEFESAKRGPYYRVSVVHETGDIYAFNQWTHQVEVLGTFPADATCTGVGRHNAGCAYELAEAALAGWATDGSKPLSWIRERLSSWRRLPA